MPKREGISPVKGFLKKSLRESFIPSSLTQTGRVIWKLNAEKGLDVNNIYDPSTGRGYLSVNTFAGYPSVMLYSITEAIRLSKYLPLDIGTRLGFEGYFGIHHSQRRINYVEIMIMRHREFPTSERLQANVGIWYPSEATRKLALRETVGFGAPPGTSFETAQENVEIAHPFFDYRGFAWNHFKLVADFDKRKYVKFLYKGKKYDLSAYSIASDTSPTDSELYEFSLAFGGWTLPYNVVFRDLVITTEEP